MATRDKHWKTVCGIEPFKVEYRLKEFLYKTFGITLPKLRDQRDYWANHRDRASSTDCACHL
ncbi:MAG: hypothetical protein LBU75_12145 [Desulfovibrio sp.]|jgi:hypothetical protein|nr:hypothetical protein [Desulfovibrio sp.]